MLSHDVYHTPLGIEVIQALEAPGVAGPVVQSVFLPNYAEWIEFRGQWRMGLDAHPVATYLHFPFELPEAAARFERLLTPDVPAPIRDLAKVVGGGAPRVGHGPWVEAWRLGDPVTERTPRAVSKLVSQLRSLAATATIPQRCAF